MGARVRPAIVTALIALALSGCVNVEGSAEWQRLEARRVVAQVEIIKTGPPLDDLLQELDVEDAAQAALRHELLTLIPERNAAIDDTSDAIFDIDRRLEPARIELKRVEDLLERLRSGDF